MSGLHVVYRSYGGENLKGRPPYYSKLIALQSLLRAVSGAGQPIELVFVNDGPIPADRLTLMQDWGEVVALPGVGSRRSLLRALHLPAERRWPGRDVAWFCEDDYLYLPDALRQLGQAADALARVDYLGLYATVGNRPPEGGLVPSWLDVPDVAPVEPVSVGGRDWRGALATTSTFGARVDAVGEDRWLFDLSVATATAWDYTACLAYQGQRPFRWSRLAADPRPGERTAVQRAKVLAAVPARAGINLLALRQRRRRRVLMTVDPAVCTHLEAAHLATGTDWAAVAAGTVEWARAGITPAGAAR